MKRIVLTIAFFMFFGAPVALAKGDFPSTKPAPMPVASMTKSAPMAPVPAAMTAPAAMPATMAPATPAMAEKPVVNVTNKVEQKPVWKTPGFWISTVGGSLVAIVFGLLIAFGVIKKTTVQGDRWTTIMKIVDNGLPAALSFVKGTKNEVDDIIYDVVAMLVKVVKARVADLTPEEERKIEALVKSRKHEAEEAAAAKPTEA